MWNKIRGPLLILSISLNLAVIAVWCIQVIWGQTTVPFAVNKHSDSDLSIRSALHREIGVSDDQWKQIEPFVLEFRQQSTRQQQKLETLRQQLLGLMAKTPTDEVAIKSKQEEILMAQKQMQNIVIGHLLKEKEILSPSQTKKMIQVIHDQCMHTGDMTSGLYME